MAIWIAVVYIQPNKMRWNKDTLQGFDTYLQARLLKVLSWSSGFFHPVCVLYSVCLFIFTWKCTWCLPERCELLCLYKKYFEPGFCAGHKLLFKCNCSWLIDYLSCFISQNRLLKSQSKVKELTRENRNKDDEIEDSRRKLDSLKAEKRKADKTVTEASVFSHTLWKSWVCRNMHWHIFFSNTLK